MGTNCFSKGKWTIFIALAFLLCNTCISQQPGGVNGTKVWYLTKKNKAGINFLYDVSGKGFESLNTDVGIKSNRNINFHPSTFFENTGSNDIDTIQFKNLNANSITCVGIFYPSKTFKKDKPILSVKAAPFYELEMAQVDRNNLKIFSFGDAFNQRNNFEIKSPLTNTSNAMKTGVFNIPSKKLPTSIWGEKSDITISSKFIGYIPELILYTRYLSNKEIRQIQSYLCIKYGTTLDTSYFDSKGDIIWDINNPKLKEFHNRVCAIGRDSSSALWQPKSNTTYEDNGYNAYEYDADSGCTNPKYVEQFIPGSDHPSLFRSLTIEFQDDLKQVPENQFLFWGDNDINIDTVDIKASGLKYKKEDFPWLKIIKGRRWLVYNKNNLVNATKLVIAGVDYDTSINSPFNKLYQPYDYQRYRYLLLSIVQDSVVSIKIDSYFGRECFSSVNERFSTRTIVWDSIEWKNNNEPYHFFTFGRIPVLDILKIDLASTLSKKSKTLDYPYFKSLPINNSVVYDTLGTGKDTDTPFKVKANDKLAFLIPDGLAIKKEGLILKVLEQGQWKILPQKSVYKEGDTTTYVLDEDTINTKAVDDKNKSQGIESEGAVTVKENSKKKKDNSEIWRRSPITPTGTVKYFISTDKLYETNSFILEIRDAIGQVTILPFKTETPKAIRTN